MKKKRSILFQAKAKLAKVLKLEFATVETDAGEILYIDSDGDASEGDAVYVISENGDYVAAPDNDYVAGSRTYVVRGGMLESITIDEEFEDAENVDPAPEATGTEVSVEEHNELVEVVNEILDVVKEQDAEIADLAEEVVMLEAELRKARGKTKGKPAEKARFTKERSSRFDFADQKMNKLIENFK